MSPSRKAQIGKSFTWIFVLIAGGAFMLIFFQIAQMQTSSADAAQRQASVEHMATLLQTLQTSQNTNRTLPGFDRTYNVTCQDGSIELFLADRTNGVSLTEAPVYIPDVLPPRPLTAVTVTYNAPMPITNVLFVIPEDRTIPYPDTAGESPPAKLQPYLEPSSSTEPVDAHKGIHRIGRLHANNTRISSCVNDNVYDQASLVYKTVRYKANRLADEQPSRCQDSYDASNETLTNLIDLASNNVDNLDAFTGNISYLQEQNNGLKRESCATLY